MDRNRARELLLSGGYTCVLCRGEDVHTSALRGVKPLVRWVESTLDTYAHVITTAQKEAAQTM